MATTRDQILTGIRPWMIAAGQSGGLVGAQVVNEDDPHGVRPVPPLATMRVSVFQNYVGRPERFYVGDPATQYVRTQCQDTVSINTYGVGAEDWLARAVEHLWMDSITTQLEAAGFSIEPVGGSNNFSDVLDDRHEIRFQQDFYVSYAQVSDGEAVTEATSIVVGLQDIDGGGPFTVPKP